MYVIVGLGNFGREYNHTRHNIGFEVVDMLASKNGISIDNKEHKAVTGKGLVAGQKCLLVKPLTYMNLSGECVRELLNFYKFDEETELIVISDDISLEVGQLRVRKKGSAGGHNGLKNIILHLGHDKFARIKVGVGEKPKNWDLADYVLGRFSEPEQKVMEEAADRACSCIAEIMTNGADAAMNLYNRKA